MRYYLKQMSDLRRQAELGLRSVADAQRLHEMTAREAEVFVAIQELEMRGLTQPIAIAPGPEESPSHRRSGSIARSG